VGQQGKVTKAQWQPLWVDYVKQHLLPRLYAFELMMAPYAIAHMKIGLKLAETGYTFPEDGPRVNVFLTNALEPAHAGYITSNSYLESPTFRGVRQSLLHTYKRLAIIDLHGNSNIGESVEIDQNVFEIQEGVAIAIGAISGAENSLLWHVDLFGLRESKYEQLGRLLIQNCPPFVPTGVQLKFVRAESASTDSYETGWPLPTLLLVNSVGIVTARDALCIQFTEKQAWDTVRDFGLREVEDASKFIWPKQKASSANSL
jgi:hypothetical protein